MIRKLWNRWPIALMPLFMGLGIVSIIFLKSDGTLAFVSLAGNSVIAIGCFIRQAWLDEQQSKLGS